MREHRKENLEDRPREARLEGIRQIFAGLGPATVASDAPGSFQRFAHSHGVHLPAALERVNGRGDDDEAVRGIKR